MYNTSSQVQCQKFLAPALTLLNLPIMWPDCLAQAAPSSPYLDTTPLALPAPPQQLLLTQGAPCDIQYQQQHHRYASTLDYFTKSVEGVMYNKQHRYIQCRQS
jgi:hypothetical protein